jgi:hypothetical protein
LWPSSSKGVEASPAAACLSTSSYWMRVKVKKVAGSYLMRALGLIGEAFASRIYAGWIDADAGRWKFAGKVSNLLEVRKWQSDAKKLFRDGLPRLLELLLYFKIGPHLRLPLEML